MKNSFLALNHRITPPQYLPISKYWLSIVSKLRLQTFVTFLAFILKIKRLKITWKHATVIELYSSLCSESFTYFSNCLKIINILRLYISCFLFFTYHFNLYNHYLRTLINNYYNMPIKLENNFLFYCLVYIYGKNYITK